MASAVAVSDGDVSGFDWSPEQLAEKQRGDSDINVIVGLLESADGKPPWDDVAIRSETTKALWSQWERQVLRDGVLYRTFLRADGELDSFQLIVPFDQRKDFIRLAHDGVTGGHLGRRRTEDQVRRHAYWPDWREDVMRYLRTCQQWRIQDLPKGGTMASARSASLNGGLGAEPPAGSSFLYIFTQKSGQKLRI